MSAISISAPVAPAVTPADGAAQAGDAGAEPGEFASLMAGLLGAGAPADEAPADAATEPVVPVVPEVADGVDPALAALAAGAAQAAPTAPGTVDTKVAVPTLPTGPAGTSTTPGRPGPTPDEGEITRTYGCTTGVLTKGAQLPGPAVPAGTTSQPGQPVLGTAASAAASPAATATPLAVAPGTEAPAAPAAGDLAPADGTGLLAGARPTDPPPVAASQSGVPTIPLPAPAPTAPQAAPPAAAPVHAGPSHVPDQVTAQVFPEIGKLAVRASSAGEGVHRITLNLHPETLGDVRVTLVVRGGEMKVSIHAATDAGRIMAESLPELRRLLASAGAGDASLAVRDSSAGGATMSSADQGSERSGPGRSGYADQQGRDAHGQDARMRHGLHATDGTNRGLRDVIPGPHDPARATRPAGVDVTV